MEISAKWWSILSDHIRTIKKSFASQQPLIDDSHIPIEPLKPSVELQKPLQPSTAKNTSNRNSSNQRPIDSPLTRHGEAQLKPAVPLPPRRAVPTAPLAQTDAQLINPLESKSSSFDAPPVNLPQTVYPDLSKNDTNMNPNMPVALQMEMAFQAAVEETKSKSTTVRNPWGDEEDNVWG